MFQSLSEKLENAFRKFKNKGKLTESDIKAGMREIKLALLEADVNFKVVKDFIASVSERAVGAEVLESLLPAQQIVKIVNEELTNLMGGSQSKLTISSKPPTVVMMVGLQGAGKTTHAGKLAGLYKKQGKNPLLVACDVYRPAAIKQLEIVGEKLGIPVFTLGDKVSPVKIAEEGLKNNYGARIGQVLLSSRCNDVITRAKAYAAAASDARMGGCEKPVVINSGSGNQGITASVPVIIYAEELQATREQLYRALLVSNLVTLHLKSGIGPLSAYCGAISAGCGAAAGITYLYGGKFREVAHTIVNALAINSGVICDGAKASCAAKIASAVEAGLLGMEMFRQGSQFLGGDGIVTKGVENTIRNVSQLASEGMRKTDAEIIKIMLS